MQMFALGWLAVELAARDGSPERAPLYIGLIGLSRAVPALTIAVVAGAIVDRVDRRRIMLVTEGLSLALSAVLALLTVLDLVTIGVVMLVNGLIGLCASFDAPARQSMLNRIVPREDIMSAIGLQSMAAHGTGVIGPALAGLLIGPIGIGGVLFANAAGYVPVMLAVFRVGPLPPVPGSSARSVAGSVRDGIVYVATDPVLRWVFVVGVGASLVARPYLQLLPAFVANHLGLGPSALSFLLAVSGAGALAGAAAVASLSGVRRRGRMFLAAAGVTASLVAVLGLQDALPAAAVVAGAASFAMLVFMGVLSTILQTTTPDGLIGRVMSLQVTMYMGIAPLGQLVLGAIASVVGIEHVYVGGGVATLALVLFCAARVPRLWDMRAQSEARPLVVRPGAAVAD